MALPFGCAVLASQGLPWRRVADGAPARGGGTLRPWLMVGLLLAQLLYLAATRARGAWIGGALGIVAFVAVRRPALAARDAPPADSDRRRGRWRRRCFRGAGARATRTTRNASRPARASCSTRSIPRRRWRAPASGCGGGRSPSIASTRCPASDREISRCCFPQHAEPDAAADGVMSADDGSAPAAQRAAGAAGGDRTAGRGRLRRDVRDRHRVGAGHRPRGARGCGQRRTGDGRRRGGGRGGRRRGLLRVRADGVPAGDARDAAAVRRFAGRARRARAGGRGCAGAASRAAPQVVPAPSRPQPSRCVLVAGGAALSYGVLASSYWRGQARAALASGGGRAAGCRRGAGVSRARGARAPARRRALRHRPAHRPGGAAGRARLGGLPGGEPRARAGALFAARPGDAGGGAAHRRAARSARRDARTRSARCCCSPICRWRARPATRRAGCSGPYGRLDAPRP